ncbi:MAG: hypothetical protein ABL886_10440 [Rhodoglobus sp.]
MAGPPVTVVGITGHRHLDDEEGMRAAIASRLADLEPPIVGVSALAEGADQLFARAVLSAGGELEVVIPGQNYRASLPMPARDEFDRLVEAASRVTTVDDDTVDGFAYLGAGVAMLDRCEVLFAVWDGGASRGTGGTADMVRRARERGLPVVVIDANRA